MNKFNYGIDDRAKITVTEEDVKSAMSAEVTLSTYLNEKHKDKLQFADGLDAFDAALLTAGIVTKGDSRYGIESSRVEKFFTTSANKILFPEFVVRTLKETINASPILTYLVGETMTITGDTMRQPTLNLDASTTDGAKNRKALRKVRVTELAEIPVGTLKLGDQAVTIYKYGRGVKASYEALRRTTIDMFRKQVELIGQYAAYDEVKVIIDTIIDGDGNNNAATVYKRSVLDAGGTATKLSMTGLLKLMVKTFPINIDTLVVDEDGLIQVATILSDKNLINGVQPYVPFKIPQGIFNGLTIIYSPDVPQSAGTKTQIIALNKNMAIRKIIEQNSMIQELATYANDQSKVMYLTENAGFGKIYDGASIVYELD